jgi:hypothetical protein
VITLELNLTPYHTDSLLEFGVSRLCGLIKRVPRSKFKYSIVIVAQRQAILGLFWELYRCHWNELIQNITRQIKDSQIVDAAGF